MPKVNWRESGIKCCPKCRIEKPATTEFFAFSTQKGLAVWCKKCDSVKAKKYRTTPERLVNSTHRECTKCSQVKAHADFPPNKNSPWGIGCYCRACQRVLNKACYEKNKPARRAAEKKRLEKCPAVHMKYRLLGLVRKAIDRHALERPVSSVTREFWKAVGYTRHELAEHLEQQFLPGMTWENRSEWHIDHIVPVSYFRPTSFEDPKFLVCWGLNNLRPLWAADNIRKRDSLDFLKMME